MKLLFLNQNYEDEGTFHRCFFLGKHLVEMGYEVTIVTISQTFPSYRIGRQIRDGVNIVTLQTYSRKKDYLFYAMRPIINSIYSLGSKYDALHAFTVAEPMTGIPTILNKIKKKPIFVDWDDWYSRGGLSDFKPFQFIMKPTMTFLEENIPKVADKVTVASETLEKRAIDIGISPDRILKVPNGANIEFIKPLDRHTCRQKLGLDQKQKIVLYMGLHSHALSSLVNTFKLISNDYPDALLLCVGDVDFNTKSLIESLNIKCIVAGRQQYTKVPYYLGASDVLALPMENNNIERARWPIRLGDYLASGRSIVANDIGEVGRLLNEKECGLTAKDEVEFAKAIVRIFDDGGLKKRLETRSRKVAEDFLSWKKIVSKFEVIYS